MSSSAGKSKTRRASKELVSVSFESSFPASSSSSSSSSFSDQKKGKDSSNPLATASSSSSSSPPSPTGNHAVLLGKHYQLDNPRDRDTFSRHCQSFFRYSYRREFPALTPYSIGDSSGSGKFSSDSGWGCMLRAAQSMLAHVYCRHFLGPDWRFPATSPQPEEILKQSPSYCNILNWFLDYPGYPHHYSIHHMVQAAMDYNKLPGEWHGPSTAAFVLRDLCRNHSRYYEGQLTVYVTPTDTIYISEIEKTCTDPSLNTTLRNLDEQKAHAKEKGLDIDSMMSKRNASLAEKPNPRVIDNIRVNSLADIPKLDDLDAIFDFAYKVNLQDVSRLAYQLEQDSSKDDDKARQPSKSVEDPLQVQESTDAFYDPLCRPPPSQVQPWLQSLLLIIPLMLGVNNINPEHIDELRQLLDCPDCVGILGGRPNHAIYFTGYLQQATPDPKSLLLYGHDPHTTFSAIEEDLLQHPGIVPPPRELLNQLHMKQHSCNGLHISSLDSSLAIGFYFRDREHFHAFCTEWRSKCANGFTLFNIQQHMPEYMREPSHAADGLDDQNDAEMMLMDEPPSTLAHMDDDKDEDYVFL